MSSRVPPSERTSQRLRELIQQGSEEGDIRSDAIRLAVRKMVEEALEAELADALGRGHYERGGGEGRGYRNGHRRGRLQSAEGEIEYSVPQVRDRDEPFRSRIREQLQGRSEALEDLAVEMYARGLSTRDIEAAFADGDGRSILSRTAVSEITERLWEEYEAFATRDLSEHRIVYLFVDGVAERLRPGQPREAVLAAWGIDDEGKKHLLHLMPGSREDTESCKSFFQDMKRRGLNDPLLVATDGAAGLIRAVEECFPRAARQRCLAHRMRNLGAKLPDDSRRGVTDAARAAYQAPSPAMAEVLRDDFVTRYEAEFPSATKCFLDDFEACIAQLRFPIAHRRAIRTTNMLERLFGEERRRTKVIPNAFGERPVMKLMYAALIRATEKWRGLRMTAFESKQLQALKAELDQDYEKRTAPVVNDLKARSSPSRVSSRSRT